LFPNKFDCFAQAIFLMSYSDYQEELNLFRMSLISDSICLLNCPYLCKKADNTQSSKLQINYK